MKTIIVIPERVPGLNGPDGLIREHFRNAKKRKTRYFITCLSQSKGSHKGRVTIHFIRYTIKLMDWDNMAASFKHIGDSLVKANIIQDDKPQIIITFLPAQVKVSKRVDQKSVVIIEDYEEEERT